MMVLSRKDDAFDKSRNSFSAKTPNQRVTERHRDEFGAFANASKDDSAIPSCLQPPSTMIDAKLTFISHATDAQLRAIVALYRQAGWWPLEEAEDLGRLGRLVRQSHCFCVAMAGEELIGMGRAISDGVSDAYVQDVTVAGPWQRSGVGSMIVQGLIARLHADGINWIGLIAERGSAPFYAQFGFSEMPNARPMLLTR